MAVLQNQQYKKDFPGNLGVDQNVTNSTAGPGKIVITPLGTSISPAQTVRISAYEWSLVPTATRTAFGLTAVAAP